MCLIMKKEVAKLVSKVVEKTTKQPSWGCMWIFYQPKVPAKLRAKD